MKGTRGRVSLPVRNIINPPYPAAKQCCEHAHAAPKSDRRGRRLSCVVNIHCRVSPLRAERLENDYEIKSTLYVVVCARRNIPDGEFAHLIPFPTRSPSSVMEQSHREIVFFFDFKYQVKRGFCKQKEWFTQKRGRLFHWLPNRRPQEICPTPLICLSMIIKDTACRI